MISLNPEPGPEQFFSLAEEGLRKDVSGTNSKISMRQPVVLKLDEDLIGSDPILLAEYRNLSAQYDHHFISFACTFMPGAGETIASAEVEVRLYREGADNPPAIILSMRPDRVLKSTEITSSATLEADFHLAKLGGGGEAKFDRETPFLIAYPAGEQGFWQFAGTEHSAIAGQYPLQMILRVPKGLAPLRGSITVSVLLNRKRFYILSDQRRDGIGSVGFTCE